MATPGSPRSRNLSHGESRVKQMFFYICVLGILLSFAKVGQANAQDRQPVEVIEVDTQGPSHPFPHFWEQMFGSGRAILSLRESYRKDLREVKSITDFQYVRFHAIFHDEVGLYDEDSEGNPVYNFSYVDHFSVCKASDRSLRDRRSLQVVFRAVERTQYRLLGRRSQRSHLLPSV